jgi:hypothetical protein
MLAGCAPAETAEPAQNVEVRSQASTMFWSWTDWSGDVEIKAWYCDWAGPGNRLISVCSVDPGYVAVGGGAEVLGNSAEGGLLTGSEPTSDLKGWRVAAKDHFVPFNYLLRAYVLGMRLKSVWGDWMTEDLLRRSMYISYVRSCNADICAGVGIPGSVAGLEDNPRFAQGDIMLGGGAWAIDSSSNRLAWNGAGQLLWQSVPLMQGGIPTAWMAQSKDHGVADPGWIEASIIGIRRCPIGFTGVLESGHWHWNGNVNSTGYRSNMFNMPDSSWATTSIGAEDQWYLGDYVGRLLTDIIPTTGTGGGAGHGGVLAYSKDHGYVDSVGNLVVHVMAVRKNSNPFAKCDGT